MIVALPHVCAHPKLTFPHKEEKSEEIVCGTAGAVAGGVGGGVGGGGVGK